MGKTTYHSALVKDSRDGPVAITMTCSEPLQSKFSGQPDYFTIKYDGEDKFYPVENDAIADTLSGYKGKTLMVTATGSREDAEILIDGEADEDRRPPARQERRAPAREERKPAPRADRRPHEPAHRLSKEEKAALEQLEFQKLKVRGARIAVAMRMSLLHAARIAEEVFGRDVASTEDVRAIGLCHFIEIKGLIDFDKLPVKWIERPDAPQERKRQPEPEPEPEPEPQPEEPESDDIPF